jgi:hypothetical protein
MKNLLITVAGGLARVAIHSNGESGEIAISAHPNPTTSKLSIENAPLNGKYSLVNMTGQVQNSGTIQSTSMSLEVESYNKGIYILTVGGHTSKVIIR